MKTKSFAATACAAALALAMWINPGAVQGQPMYDRIHVNLPYKITLGEKTLQPGDYTIQQLPDNGGGSRVLLFYTNDGMKFETSAMTIPALDINTARDTKLILGHIGEDYYINKIWVQGKDYGYELPMPKGLKSREKEMSETTVAAQYQPTSENVKTETADNNANVNKDNDQKAVAPPPVTAETETRPAQETVAQNNEATHPVEQPATVAATPTTNDANANTADRAMTDQDAAARTTPAPTRMPNTAANWLMMLLSGGTLSGAGLMLRRKR